MNWANAISTAVDPGRFIADDPLVANVRAAAAGMRRVAAILGADLGADE